MAASHELAQGQDGWMYMLFLIRAIRYDYKESFQFFIVYILTSIRPWLGVATAEWA